MRGMDVEMRQCCGERELKGAVCRGETALWRAAA